MSLGEDPYLVIGPYLVTLEGWIWKSRGNEENPHLLSFSNRIDDLIKRADSFFV